MAQHRAERTKREEPHTGSEKDIPHGPPGKSLNGPDAPREFDI